MARPGLLCYFRNSATGIKQSMEAYSLQWPQGLDVLNTGICLFKMPGATYLEMQPVQVAKFPAAQPKFLFHVKELRKKAAS